MEELLDMLNAFVEVPQWYLVAIAIVSVLVSMAGFIIVSSLTYKRALLRPAGPSLRSAGSHPEKPNKRTLKEMTEVDTEDLSEGDSDLVEETDGQGEVVEEIVEEEEVPPPPVRRIVRRVVTPSQSGQPSDPIIRRRAAVQTAPPRQTAKPAAIVKISRKKE